MRGGALLPLGDTWVPHGGGGGKGGGEGGGEGWEGEGRGTTAAR